MLHIYISHTRGTLLRMFVRIVHSRVHFCNPQGTRPDDCCELSGRLYAVFRSEIAVEGCERNRGKTGFAYGSHSGSVYLPNVDSFSDKILFPHAGTSPSKNCLAALLTPPPHDILLGSERNHKGLTTQTTHALRHTARTEMLSLVLCRAVTQRFLLSELIQEREMKFGCCERGE